MATIFSMERIPNAHYGIYDRLQKRWINEGFDTKEEAIKARNADYTAEEWARFSVRTAAFNTAARSRSRYFRSGRRRRRYGRRRNFWSVRRARFRKRYFWARVY